MRIYNMSKSARDEVVSKIKSMGFDISKSHDLKIAETDDPALAIIFDKDENLYIGRKDESVYFPLLKDVNILPHLPSATVDSGAVKFVCNGANVMRPGILSFEGTFATGDLIVVKEVKHGKAIAVGHALGGNEELKAMKKGASVENLHYVGDKIWEALKGIE